MLKVYAHGCSKHYWILISQFLKHVFSTFTNDPWCTLKYYDQHIDYITVALGYIFEIMWRHMTHIHSSQMPAASILFHCFIYPLFFATIPVFLASNLTSFTEWNSKVIWGLFYKEDGCASWWPLVHRCTMLLYLSIRQLGAPVHGFTSRSVVE